MADNGGISNDDLQRIEKFLELQQKTNSSAKEYLDAMEKVKVISENLKHIEREKNKILDTIDKLEKSILTSSGKQKKLLEQQLLIEKANLALAERTLKNGKEELFYLEQSVKQSSLLVASTKSLVGQLKNVGGKLSNQLGYLLEQQKAVKVTGFNMGILSNQAGVLKANLYKASISTNMLGVDTKELGKMQSLYSEGIGRAVVLSEQGNLAMSELSAGTVLGAEGAAELVKNMDGFNLSAEQSRDLVEDMLNKGRKMGVDSSKLTKNLAKNINMANKYHFKGGIEGLTKMATIATKFKIEMKSVGAFADKLFDPEGAVEMASKLSVLGGAWSKLGDPFELMFKARNDMEGLTKDIISATEVTGTFNKKTGELQFSSLEMHRLREAAKATGIEYEELANMAQEVIKNTAKMGQMVTGGKLSKEEKEYISAISNWDKDSGKFFVEVLNKDGKSEKYNLDELYKLDADIVKNMKNTETTLKKRAEDAQTFDETWINILNTFKSTLLPAFDGFSKSMDVILTQIKESGIFQKIGEWSVKIGTFLAEWPKTIATAMAGMVIAKEAWWIARGAMLGVGFNSVASGKGGITDLIGGKGGAVRNLSKASKYGKFARGIGGAGAGLLSAGISGYDEYTTNKENGMSTGENAGRTGIRAGLSGGGAWGGAALGATIGTMIFPGVGTAIGGLIGGIAGGLAGDKIGDSAGDVVFGDNKSNPKVHQDFISRPGSEPISFSSADTLVGLKKDGGIGKALVENNTTKSSNIGVNFNQPLKIEGNINLISGNNSVSIDLDNPFLIRELSKIIQEELSRAIGGGRISSNPI